VVDGYRNDRRRGEGGVAPAQKSHAASARLDGLNNGTLALEDFRREETRSR
jgi:hypothetical protein